MQRFWSRLKSVIALVVLFGLFGAQAPDAFAQKPGVEVDELPPAARPLVIGSKDLPLFRTRSLPSASVDVKTAQIRSAYNVGHTNAVLDLSGLDAADAARTYIESTNTAYGWRGGPDDLRLVNVTRSSVSSHVLFQQTVGGVPVLYRYVKVSVDEANRPTLIMNGFDQNVLDRRPTNSVVVTARSAAQTVADLFETASDDKVEPELSILPVETPRFVWRVITRSNSAGGEWEALVDATTGSVVSVRDRSFRRHAGTLGSSKTSATSGTVARTLVDGSGLVFDPDPISTAGVNYGPPFVDSGDADQVDINNQRISVTLRDISLGTDNLYRLDGPYVTIVGGGALAYVPPAQPTSVFDFTRSDDRFEAVNSYYHVDKSQRYVQTLGYLDVRNDGVSVNPLALVADNSVYSPSANLIELGAGGVDDAEDAGVIWHEYAHALLEASAPGLVDAPEGQALHEGWADYWASSYMRSLADAGKTSRVDWQNVFRWDSGDGQLWPGRRVGVAGTYPDDFHCEDVGDINHDGCNIYADGLIWASTLMEIQDDLGREVSDKLNLQSHYYLSAPATFRDAAEALIQADVDLYGGQYGTVLLSILGDRGFVDATQFAPVTEHDQLHDTEAVGSSALVHVSAASATSTVDSVFVYYSTDASGPVRVDLSAIGDDAYEGRISLPQTPGTVSYYVEAVDANGRRSVLPKLAPVEQYTFAVGPDSTPPEVDHEPQSTVSLVTWPLTVRAKVTDNLAVDSVTIDYELQNGQGSVVESGSFGLARLTADQYEGAFPIAGTSVAEGYSVHYTVHAIDASAAGNQTVSPATGEHVTTVTLSGTLVTYDFETAADLLSPTGVWERGVVSNLLQVAHSGSQAWGTRVASSYPDATTFSTLALPPLNLENLPDVYLTFWHWYDLEHEGPVIPGQDNFTARIWDGGNIKISVDNGPWTLVEPMGGYPGRVQTTANNPLAGERVFGGYSYGWRKEVVQIPGGGQVRIRFEFGTDDGNSEESLAFAGWFLDDLAIVTALEDDATPPLVTEVPPELYVADIDLDVPPILVKASDDIGIESVVMLIDSDSTTVSIRDVRLGMDFSDPGRFVANIAPVGVQAGDRIDYRMRIRDFGGNEVMVPAVNEPALRIIYKTINQASALDEAVATGYWTEDGGGWVAASDGDRKSRSGLILEPLTLPTNADAVYLDVRHAFVLATGLGGNVKLSDDDGATWTVIEPVGGYPGRFSSGGHPMSDEDVFLGTQTTAVVSSFDLTAFAGRQVRVQLDFGSSREPSLNEYWSVEGVSVRAESVQSELQTAYELVLNANYPNPFSNTTTVSYTIPEESVVQVGVYDLLGRRVEVPVYARQSAGPHTFTFDGTNLADGVYVLRLIAAGRQVTRTIVIAR